MGTVLVVDDQLELRTLFQRVIEHAGHSVVAVCNGQEALRVTETWAPDLMLLDLAMPQMDGLDFLGLARRRPSLANVPVIMLSGLMTADQAAAARKLGVSDQLLKGEFTTRELRARVAKFLSPAPRPATTAA